MENKTQRLHNLHAELKKIKIAMERTDQKAEYFDLLMAKDGVEELIRELAG